MNDKPDAVEKQSLHKQTGMLPNLDEDARVSESKLLRYEAVVDDVTQKYSDADHVLMVYFPQRAEPFSFPDTDLIVIGRTGGDGVNLDTSPFQGRELGVSRVHAEISFENGSYFVRDLKSTNGTWLNTKKLDPLVRQAISAGDQLRLGHCLTIVYIKEK